MPICYFLLQSTVSCNRNQLCSNAVHDNKCMTERQQKERGILDNDFQALKENGYKRCFRDSVLMYRRMTRHVFARSTKQTCFVMHWLSLCCIHNNHLVFDHLSASIVQMTFQYMVHATLPCQVLTCSDRLERQLFTLAHKACGRQTQTFAICQIIVLL